MDGQSRQKTMRQTGGCSASSISWVHENCIVSQKEGYWAAGRLVNPLLLAPLYPYPPGFHPGEGKVQDLNVRLYEAYSSMGYLFNQFQKATREIQRSYGHVMCNPCMPQMRPDPDVSYSLMAQADCRKKLIVRLEYVLSDIEKVLELGGRPFLIPQELSHPIRTVLGEPRDLLVRGVTFPAATAFQGSPVQAADAAAQVGPVVAGDAAAQAGPVVAGEDAAQAGPVQPPDDAAEA